MHISRKSFFWHKRWRQDYRYFTFLQSAMRWLCFIVMFYIYIKRKIELSWYFKKIESTANKTACRPVTVSQNHSITISYAILTTHNHVRCVRLVNRLENFESLLVGNCAELVLDQSNSKTYWTEPHSQRRRRQLPIVDKRHLLKVIGSYR